MTPEAAAHAIAKLQAELASIRMQRVRNAAEAGERDDRVAQLAAEIALIRDNRFKVGHP
jgi:hypothetical protein